MEICAGSPKYRSVGRDLSRPDDRQFVHFCLVLLPVACCCVGIPGVINGAPTLRRVCLACRVGRDIHVARRSGAFCVHAVLCASRGSDAAVVLLRLNEHVVSVCQRTLMLFLCVGSGPQTCSFLILLSVLLLIVCSFRMPVGTGGVSGRTYAFAAADIQFAGSYEWAAGCQRGRPV